MTDSKAPDSALASLQALQESAAAASVKGCSDPATKKLLEQLIEATRPHNDKRGEEIDRLLDLLSDFRRQ